VKTNGRKHALTPSLSPSSTVNQDHLNVKVICL